MYFLGIEKIRIIKGFLALFCLIFCRVLGGIKTYDETRSNLLLLALEVIKLLGHEGHKFIKKVQALHFKF
jgi:hypothetical protein